ncbi:MAG: hypothetical protein A2Y34_09225 [Spirochaetes bacterium GWC1_27_15]|nr:MAG: hypothetical protein A2Y34_09225 [Spirochaetes bacterium GWC1_27_15]
MSRMNFIFFLCLFIITNLYLNSQNPEVKMVVAFEDNTDYPWIIDNGTGIDFELLNLIAKKLNIQIEYKKYPWKRCLDLLKENSVDGLLNASFKIERLENGVYPIQSDGKNPDETKSFHTGGYSLYKLKGAKLEWDGKTIKNVEGKIGAQLGFSIIDFLKNANIEVDDSSKTINTNIEKLLKNRICGAALPTTSTDFIISKTENYNQIEKISPPLQSKPYYFMLSYSFFKRYPDISKEIWEQAKKLKNSKEYNKIMSDFFAKNE